jgi:hypothetical protein
MRHSNAALFAPSPQATVSVRLVVIKGLGHVAGSTAVQASQRGVCSANGGGIDCGRLCMSKLPSAFCRRDVCGKAIGRPRYRTHPRTSHVSIRLHDPHQATWQ